MKTRALAPGIVVACGMALAVFSPAAAQESGTFTLTQNGQQMATEEFTRTDDLLETEFAVTGQALILTEATLDDDAVVDRMEIRVFPPQNPDAEPLQTIAAEFANDSVHVEQPIGAATVAQSAATGTVPFLNPSPSHLEQILRRARALGGSEVTVQVWVPGQGPGQVFPAQVTFHDDDTATLALGAVAFEIETDTVGRLLGGEVPSQNVTIERR